MPARKPTTILSWPLARELAAAAGCDPRAVQRAARGEPGHGDGGRAASIAVAAYFAEHPAARPDGWKPPAVSPLPAVVARELSVAADVTPRTILRAARGERGRGSSGRRAEKAVAAYFAEHPAARAAPLGTEDSEPECTCPELCLAHPPLGLSHAGEGL